MTIIEDNTTSQTYESMPLLPLRDIVVFPYMIVPLFVGRERSISALEQCMLNDRKVLLIAQKKPKVDEPAPSDLYNIGTIAEVLQLLKLPDGAIKVLVEGVVRVKIDEYVDNPNYYQVNCHILEESDAALTNEVRALMRMVVEQFEEYVKLNRKVPPETLMAVSNIEEPGRLADVVVAHLNLRVKEKQRILESVDITKRMTNLADLLGSENEILNIEKRIRGNVRNHMEKTQREYYLNEQLKAIQNELGYKDEANAEHKELSKKIEDAKMSEEAKETATKELKRLQKMPAMSAEATVIRNYIDWLVCLPWEKRTRERISLKKAEMILEEDHYGLKDIKLRILEFLAVKKLKRKTKGPIICFCGPPGVGKTSLAKSIARSINRNFVRMSLGGMRDEAEIRGHRRTYIGAMPGKILQLLKKSKAKNPLILLDEVDKMSMDFRGDPSSALLEVLDPEQNKSFNDHFLEVDFDLSDVMFITTANVLSEIPPPLRDRMEVITLSGYTENEKLQIALRFLLPKQYANHGLTKENIHLSRDAIRMIIRRYNREAGVRNLEREIAKVCRKVAKVVVEKGKDYSVRVTERNLHNYLGVPRYSVWASRGKSEIGVATALAWTQAGGEILSTEAISMPGKGSLTLTGKLGDVMKESASAALSYIRNHSVDFDLKDDFYSNTDIHIHVPEGAVPKDGPSAGVTMVTAMVSVLTGIPVRMDLAMTGEITLQGKVLPIGGLKEKIIAAHSADIPHVIVPKENEKDLKEIPPEILKKLTIHPVDMVSQVLDLALVRETGNA